MFWTLKAKNNNISAITTFRLCKGWQTFPGRAFTLVELLIIMAIISVGMLLLLSGLNRALESAQQLQCGHQLREVANAGLLYAYDNRDYLPLSTWANPPVSGRTGLLGPYLNLHDAWEWQYDTILTCPSLKRMMPFANSSFAQWRRTYTYNACLPLDTYSYYPLAPKKAARIKNPSSTIFFFDGGYLPAGLYYSPMGDRGNTAANILYPHYGRQNVAFADAHVALRDDTLWSTASNACWFTWLQ